MPSFESIHLALPATQRSYLAYNSGISVFFGSFRHPLHQHGKLRIPRCVQTLCVPGEEFIDSISRQSLASVQKSGVDVSAAAELGFYVPIGANVSSSSSKQYYKACSQRVSQQSLAGIPCRPLLVVASCAPDYYVYIHTYILLGNRLLTPTPCPFASPWPVS